MLFSLGKFDCFHTSAEAFKVKAAVNCSQKERRLEQEKLRNIKTLGEAGADVDDLAVWVESSRIAEVRAKEEERAKAAKLARQLEEQVCFSAAPSISGSHSPGPLISFALSCSKGLRV